MFSGGPVEVARPLSCCFFWVSCLVCSTSRVLLWCISCLGLFLCFTLIYAIGGEKHTVGSAWLPCAMAWGRSTLASSYPAVAMYPILFDYSTSPAGMLPLFFPACKFLQPPVQVQVRFLSRPVTGNYSHDHSRHCEEQDDQYRCFHMMSVPCIRPSIKLMAMALMNMPAMIHKMSIISVPTRQAVWLLHNR